VWPIFNLANGSIGLFAAGLYDEDLYQEWQTPFDVQSRGTPETATEAFQLSL
jgi:hypothetical protein